AFTTPVFIGGPQTWDVATGETITINGQLHTIISDLTITGAGDTTINGQIDGGGTINTVGGAEPGGIIKAGTGALTRAAASNCGGDVTVQSGSGTLTIAPAGGAAATFSGALFGAGPIVINSAGNFSIGGGASNFTGTIGRQGGGDLTFVPATGMK